LGYFPQCIGDTNNREDIQDFMRKREQLVTSQMMRA
jgi:hypothetical protein